MEKLIWLVIVIVVMFVMVAIMASIFQGSVNRNGGVTEDLMDQTTWTSACSGWCLETCLKTPGFDDDLDNAVPTISSCIGYWCNCSDMV